jgi:cellulose synthase/poly-beta-1,6-N-acetylglucosamine synthase-like glycosyltransferase
MNTRSPMPSLSPAASGPDAARKSAALIGSALGLFGVTTALLGPRLATVLLGCETVAQRLTLGAFAGLLLVFWMLGAYYVSLTAFYLLTTLRPRRTRPAETPDPASDLPPVALLCPTCDDFQADAAVTAVMQDYPACRVFILDDSRSEDSRRAIDRFARAHPERVTVIRRPSREGFKAGNLNHALRGPAREFPLFAVLDADERLPANFLSALVPRLWRGRYAFVQAMHEPNPAQPGAFVDLLRQTILPFWSVLLACKNRFGFVPCVGHGVLVRHEAWQAAGGFPEVASEDLAFSLRLLCRGLRGEYAPEVVCREDFPATMAGFLRQQQRYMLGVLQALWRAAGPLRRSRAITWTEKFDVWLSVLPLYVPALCLLFVLTAGLALPLCFGRPSWAVAQTVWGTVRCPFLQSFDGRFAPLWNPLFVYVSLFFSLSPALPVLALAVRGRIRRPFRLLLASNVAYMAAMPVFFSGLVAYWTRRTVEFHPTGQDARCECRAAPRAGRTGEVAMACAGLLLALALCATLNVGLAAVAVCPLLGCGHGALRPRIGLLAGVVFGGVVAQAVLGAVLCASPLSLPPLVLSIHF